MRAPDAAQPEAPPKATPDERVAADAIVTPTLAQSAESLVAVMPVEQPDGRYGWRLWVGQDKPRAFEHASVLVLNADQADQRVPSPLASWLAEHGQTGRRVVMLLSASDCFAVPITITDLARKGRQQAMVYRVEESLPIDAEDLAVGFLGQGPDRLAIAASINRVESCLRELESAGLTVRAIVPEALIAAEAVRSQESLPPGGTLCLTTPPGSSATLENPGTPDSSETLCNDGCSYDVFTCCPKSASSSTRYLGWHHFKTGSRLAMHLLADPPETARLVGDETSPLHLPENTAVVRYPGWDRAASVAEWCHALLERRAEPPIDLMRVATKPIRPAGWGSRLQRPLQALAVAAALLLASVIATGWLNLQQDQREAADYQQQLRQAFMDARPGQPVPASLLSRLRSEARRVQSLHHSSESVTHDRQNPRSKPSADTVLLLAQVVESLPTDLRFRVSDLRLDGRRLYMAGQARSHTDAQRLGNALAAVPGVNPDPPRTERQQDRNAFRGVFFTLQAELNLTPPAATPPGSPEAEQARRNGSSRPAIAAADPDGANP